MQTLQRNNTDRKQAGLKAQMESNTAKLQKEVMRRARQLAESEARLRAITGALPDLIFVYDEDGRYVEVLTAKTDLLYGPAEKLKGKRLHDIIPAPKADAFLNAIRKTIRTGRGVVLEYQLKVPAGRCWFEARTGLINMTVDEKKCVVFVARDITDRKRAEELEDQNLYLREEIRSEHNYGEIIGASPPMRHLFTHLEMVAETDSTVLITGETGTGKELIARAIHRRSGRKDKALVKVNCGAIPEGLVESELFGHEKGAFTGATIQKKGKFELAHKGTIFLDEIGELSHETQIKLLRVLQEQEFERVGGLKMIRVNVRVIAATNRDLQLEVQQGRFRSDLFFRLNIFPIQVPPLRDRCDDIPLLTQFFIDKFSRRMGKRIEEIHPGSLTKLNDYNWPGNVRELANILERAVILCQSGRLEKKHICGLMNLGQPENQEIITLAEAERRHIIRALEQTNGILGGPKGAAKVLGMKRSTLWSRMQKLDIAMDKTYYKAEEPVGMD